jgi:uncharacterized protein (TIGR02466 family)
MILGNIIHEYKLDCDQINKQVIDFLYDYKKVKSDSDVRSNRNGWQKNHLEVFPQLKPLTDLIAVEFEKFIINEMLPLVETRFYLGNLFCNINPPGAGNVPHVHQGDFTGVYYLQAPEDCGILGILNPHQCSNTARMTALFGAVKLEQKIVPAAGVGYFFPTHLVHYVEENRSTEDRISLSYNINVEPK